MDSRELKLQSQCFTKHWNYYPQYRKRLCCVNNNSQNAVKGALNKSIGVVSGVTDMFYLGDEGKVIWIEFKVPGGKQSENQKAWEQLCKSLGHEYRLVFTENEFWETINLPNPA